MILVKLTSLSSEDRLLRVHGNLHRSIGGLSDAGKSVGRKIGAQRTTRLTCLTIVPVKTLL